MTHSDSLIPHLSRRGTALQGSARQTGAPRLIVDGWPFLMLAGEVHNSSSSSLAYMEPIWDRLKEMHLNTAIAPLYWELVEPKEGQYDFRLVDGLIAGARKRGLRLVLLWFASWKNATSSYAPGWVKSDLERFPRMQLAPGQNANALSCFGVESREADARAFAAVMGHVRSVDEGVYTVVYYNGEDKALVESPPFYLDVVAGPLPAACDWTLAALVLTMTAVFVRRLRLRSAKQSV